MLGPFRRDGVSSLVVFLLLGLLFGSASSQAVSATLKYAYKGVSEWAEGTTSSPVFYEPPTITSTSPSLIVGSAYYDVYAVDAETGEKKWGHNTYPSSSIGLQPRFEVGVVMAENWVPGHDVVFVVGSDKTQVSVFAKDGTLLKKRMVAEEVGRRVCSLSISRGIKSASEQTLLVGIPSSNKGRYPNLWILDSNLDDVTNPVPVANSAEGTASLGVFGRNVAAFDLDGDGTKEVVVPSDDFSVATWKLGKTKSQASVQYPIDTSKFPYASNMWSKVIFSRDFNFEFTGWTGSNADHKPFFAHGITTVIPVTSFPAFASVGRTEPIIAISGLYATGFGVTADQYEYHTVFLLNPDRTRLQHPSPSWDWRMGYEGCKQFHTNSQAPTPQVSISYADLTGDGFPDLIFPCTDGRMHAVKLDHSNVPGFPYDLGGDATWIRAASEAMIFKRSRDAHPTLIFTTWGRKDESPRYGGELILLSATGTIIQKLSLPAATQSGKSSGSQTGVTLFRWSAPGRSSNLHAAIMTRYAGLVVYELQNTADATILWGSVRGSAMRNGEYGVSTTIPSCGGTGTTTECSGHGTCSVSSVCVCNSGWSGTICNDPVCSGVAPECSGHGTCSSPNNCNCNSGWSGSICNVPDPCVPSCGSHGTCDTGSMTCDCNTGFSGSACSETLNVEEEGGLTGVETGLMVVGIIIGIIGIVLVVVGIIICVSCAVRRNASGKKKVDESVPYTRLEALEETDGHQRRKDTKRPSDEPSSIESRIPPPRSAFRPPRQPALAAPPRFPRGRPPPAPPSAHRGRGRGRAVPRMRGRPIRGRSGPARGVPTRPGRGGGPGPRKAVPPPPPSRGWKRGGGRGGPARRRW